MKKRMRSVVFCVICMLVLLLAAGCDSEKADKKDVKSNSSAEYDFGLADNTKEGAILHAFSWSFATIKESMADIAAAGYTSVQTSPINECYDGDDGMQLYGDGKWYYHYQPTDYKIGNYQLGTRDEFIEMCKEADRYGIKIIVDVAVNHTTTHTDMVSEDLINAVGGADKLYHKNGLTAIADYSDRLDCTAFSMGGLPDIDTENPEYQKYIIDYLNDCIACGADGFRFDAAKHVGLMDDPSEDEQKCDFWDNVLGGLNNREDLFLYGEVLQGSNDRIQDYISAIGAATASSYGQTLRNCFKMSSLDTLKLTEYKYNCKEATDVVLWVESHDNYINDNTSQSLDDNDIILAWSVIASRAEGTPLFFDRPYGATKENVWGDVNEIGISGSVLYKSQEISAINHFRNAMIGEDEKVFNPEDTNQVLMIERGSKGLVIANIGDEYALNIETSLIDGTYINRMDDKTEYTVKDGKITGTVPQKTAIVLYNEDYVEREAMPVVSAEADEYYAMKSDKVDVTLHVSGADEGIYVLGDGEETKYTDGTVITVGEQLKEGDRIRLTVKAVNKDGFTSAMSYLFTKEEAVVETTITDGMTVYFTKPDSWGGQLFAYIYADEDGNVKILKDWPGTEMKEEGDGKYSFTFSKEWRDGLVMFSDGTNQYPGANEAGLPIEEDKVYEQ